MGQIEKEKKGIKLFLHLLKQYFFTLIFLNIIFIITCIPIITIGPACKALAKVTMDMVRDKEFFPVQTYFTEFRVNFLKTAGVGVIFSIILGVMGYSILVNVNDKELTTVLQIFVMFSIVIVLFLLASIMYALRLFATIDLPTKEIWKNAFLLVLMSPKQMVTLLFLIVIPTIVAVMFFQIGISAFVIWHFAMSSVVSSMNAWTIIKKYVAADYQNHEK